MEKESPEIVSEQEIDEINRVEFEVRNDEIAVYNRNAEDILEMAGLPKKQELEYVPEVATREDIEKIRERNQEKLRKNEEIAGAAWKWACENQDKLD